MSLCFNPAKLRLKLMFKTSTAEQIGAVFSHFF